MEPTYLAIDFFEHDADIGITGRGGSIEEAFENAARAMFSVIAPPGAISAQLSIELQFEESDPELALVVWLNTLLGEARARAMTFTDVRLRRDGAHWHACVHGAPWRSDVEHGVEVKGATLTMLKVEQVDGIWNARCVIDV
jgi:SHS2 domain-containing protein